MFDWLGDFIGGIGSAIGGVFDFLGEQISNAIWNTMLKWIYETIYNAVADFFTMMGNMGADIFDLAWVQAAINLFTMFGWALFAAGTAVAVFDAAIEYQSGRANIKTTAINVLKGFFACSLIGIVPVELYKFCISLQNTFSKDLSSVFAGQQGVDLAGQSTNVLEGTFALSNQVQCGLFNILCMIAFAYCVVKIFFANIKRGGILLIQMAVGALYMFSVPRGYQDGFNQWMKQIAAICLTAFMQTTLLFLGLLTFPGNMLLGMGVMLSANEVPRIAQINERNLKIMTTYLYPKNLKATANMWLWSLRDFAIMSIALLLSILILAQTRIVVPLAVTLCFGFLTIRLEDTTVLDFIRCAVKYFISTQQTFFWLERREKTK